MLLLGIAGMIASIACAALFVTGRMSIIGRTLAFAFVAMGVALGSTAGTIAAGAGASDIHSASIGIIAGGLLAFAGNMAIRKLIKKVDLRHHS
ncbi:hypothetical protein [Cohnella lupini]|uniref:Uncharacterized protein n=1 Tax=Cohnella lupini TaxID=1294267 RepID=A0A3D9IBN5_9BACL|nr:hypothetical protein [Cohnella lupini]RED58616.1 hypothetical protein DFP95_108143 [Cohnella lupini]